MGCFIAILASTSNISGSFVAYLTIWTYILLCLYQLSSLFSTVICHLTFGRQIGSRSDSAALADNGISNEKRAVVSEHNVGYIEAGEKITYGSVAEVSSNSTQRQSVDRNSMEILVEPTEVFTCWHMKLTWLLASVLYVFGIVVTLVYFTALFPSIGVSDGFIHDLDMHAFNSLQIILDIFIVARPVRLLHIIYPLIYGVCYLVFSVIYWSQDKTNNVLYPDVLDWNQPGRTGIFMGLLAIVGIPLLQLILFGIFRLRLFIYKRVFGADYLD